MLGDVLVNKVHLPAISYLDDVRQFSLNILDETGRSILGFTASRTRTYVLVAFITTLENANIFAHSDKKERVLETGLCIVFSVLSKFCML